MMPRFGNYSPRTSSDRRSRTRGHVRRGFIGVSAQTVPVPRRHAVAAGIDNKMGALLIDLDQQAAASKAGLLSGDVVVRLDDKTVGGVDDLTRLLDRGA